MSAEEDQDVRPGGSVIGPETQPPSQAAQDAAEAPGGRTITMGATARILSGQLKVAEGGSSGERGGTDESRRFTIYCDEPPFLGGEGRYPQPLLYVAAGVGF